MKAPRMLYMNKLNILIEETVKPGFDLCFRYCNPLLTI